MMFKRSPSIPKTRAYKKTVECPVAVLVALSTTVRRAKQRIACLCRLLMSANTSKHGTGRKPCDARQHFIQTDRQDDEEEKEEEHVEELIDHVLFEWSSILGLGMGEANANDDEGLEVVEEGQVRPPWPTGNVPN
jgi:hypothetical protein